MEKLILLVDLASEYKILKREIDKAIRDVLESGVFILGKNVQAFEEEFASYLGVKYGVGVACGTDALILALKALGLKEGQEVIIPANSYPTAFAVAATGVRIKLVDIDPQTLNIDSSKIEQAVSSRTFAIVPVHLYGLAVEMEPILKIAKKHNLFVVEDCAQAHGAIYQGKKVGTLADIGCFSFYPTKNLGCYGDGGMVVTNNKKLAQKLCQLRMYGEKRRYQSEEMATHSRLDELQAAILRVKLKKLDQNNKLRQKIAYQYFQNLKSLPIILPKEESLSSHVFHLFVVRTRKRNKLKAFLQKNGIETAVHYPFPIHQVLAFSFLGYHKGDFPEAEKASREILSLPCYPQLKRRKIKTICNLIKHILQY